MKSIYLQVNEKIRTQISKQLRNEVSEEVINRVGDYVSGSFIFAQVRSQVRRKIGLVFYIRNMVI